ncbi:MAG: extracellular solute-binding protein [Lachnospiraceae bacterium]|nr:extracellular solute-binding protein [Lachnospiraceae bacterium]
MKRRREGYFCFLIIAGVFVLTMAGCGKKKEVKQEEEKNTAYKECVLLLEGAEGDIRDFFVKNEKLYVFTAEWTEKEGSGDDISDGSSAVFRMYSADLDGGNVTEISLPQQNENVDMKFMSGGEDNNIVFLVSTYDGKDKSSECLVKTDMQGKEVFHEDITHTIEKENIDNSDRSIMDRKGRLVYIFDNEIKVLDEQGRFLWKVKIDSRISGIARMKNGQIACAFNNQEGAQVKVLDIDGKKWGDTFTLDLQNFESTDALLDGQEYDFYYKDSAGIYGYDIEEARQVKVMDYIASNLNSSGMVKILPIGKEQFLGRAWTDNGENSMGLILYSKADLSGEQVKKVITIGLGEETYTSIEEEIVAFNKESTEYKIEVKQYPEMYYETKMNLDILAGRAPDIIVGLQDLPVKNYVSKGVLEDLTLYFENDPEIGEHLIDSVAEAMKIDGRFYYTAPGFSINTIIGKTEDVGEESGWTFDDMKKLLEKKGTDTRIFYMQNKEILLITFLDCGLDDYVDWDKGECFFDGEDFKNILELCNTGEDAESEWNNEEYVRLMRDGKILLVGGTSVWWQMQECEELFGSDITFIGYPNEKKQGSYFTFSNQMGIYYKSEVKQGAWEFIRRFMTKEYFERRGAIDIPVREDCLDLAIQKFNQGCEECGQYLDYESMTIKVEPLTQERERKLRELIKNTRTSNSSDSALMEIIEEEAKVYFSGDRNIEETLKIIQKRAQTYINEGR